MGLQGLGGGQLVTYAGFDELRQPEVQHLQHALAGDHDVGRLEVPMNNAGGVGGGERVGDLHRVFQRLAEGQAFALDELVERLAIDPFHGDEVDAIRRTNVVDGNDIGMVERRGGSGLLGEALFPFEVDHRLAGQDLDGDRTPQTRVERPVNRAHASLAQLFDYAIVP